MWLVTQTEDIPPAAFAPLSNLYRLIANTPTTTRQKASKQYADLIRKNLPDMLE